MARLARARGIVLRVQDHAETDRIAVLLTASEGRLDVLAKGARRLERASGAALDVSNVVDVIYYRRPGLALAREVDLVQAFPGLKADIDRLQAALEGLAWSLKLVPRGQPDPGPFRLTLEFLTLLGRGGDPRPFLLGYELRLLSRLGHAPHLSSCVSCGRGEDLTWSPEAGGFLCRRCGGEGEVVPPAVVHTLQALARLPFSALGRVRASADTFSAIAGMLAEFARVQLAR